MPEPRRSLSDLLAVRGDPMLGATSEWASHLLDVPEDSALPLAMSGPHPLAVGSYGAEVLDWSRRNGLSWSAANAWSPPRWWQELAIVRQFEHDSDGNLVWREVIESGPRRIGKSVRLRMAALWRLSQAGLIGEDQLVMLVSKDLSIGREIHSKAWNWAKARDWTVRQQNGQEELSTAGGDGRWLLRAPEAVYGFDIGYGQVDEAWDVKPTSIQDGLEPALLERRWPQLHLTSTAHVRASSLMRSRLMNSISGVSSDTLLMLWGAHPDADLDDPKTWRSSSPHWSADRERLVTEKWKVAKAGEVDAEQDDPDPIRGWAAQYLNVWPFLLNAGGSKVLPKWGDLSAPVRVGAPAGLGVASDPDGTWLSFGAAVVGEPLHLALLSRMTVSKRRAFVEEVARVANKYRMPVVVDKGGPASFLISDLENSGVPLELVGGDRYAQAVADLVQAVVAGEVEHGGYPDLDAAVMAADWRKYGERNVFARRSADISALESVTLALHWAKSHEVSDWMNTFG